MFVFVRFVSVVCVSCCNLIVDSGFWLALSVDVDLRLPNHIKYCYLYVDVFMLMFPLAQNHNINLRVFTK